MISDVLLSRFSDSRRLTMYLLFKTVIHGTPQWMALDPEDRDKSKDKVGAALRMPIIRVFLANISLTKLPHIVRIDDVPVNSG